MFGIYRTFLSLLVVIGHLFGPFQLGTYAVFGFYVLSGYLMTYIMQINYGYSFYGKLKFAVNRMLRIYPPYFIAILLSITILIVFGTQVTLFKSNIYIPTNITEIIQNIFILFPRDANLRLSPPTWALTVELFFYMLICLGISRSKETTLIWFLASLVITVILIANSTPWMDRYYPITAASLPFSIGGLIFHHKEMAIKKINNLGLKKPVIWIFIICLNFCFCFVFDNYLKSSLVFGIGFYLNLVLVTICTICLIDHQSMILTSKTDNIIGNYSYPIYLLHWQSGAIIYSISGHFLNISFLSLKGLIFLILSIILTFLFSYLIIQFVEKRIEKVRRKIKLN